jgi:adenylate cyclase
MLSASAIPDRPVPGTGRTLATFMFADLVGFSAMTEARGDEHAATMALAFHAAVRSLLPEHGATEIKTIGDAIMLRVPDAGEAVRLGGRIVRRLCDAGLPPVRVGMDTGWAVGLGADWFGSTVNRAARLCGASGPNELLVSGPTRAAARGAERLGLGEAESLHLRNIPEPVPAHRGVPLVSARVGAGAPARRRHLHAV